MQTGCNARLLNFYLVSETPNSFTFCTVMPPGCVRERSPRTAPILQPPPGYLCVNEPLGHRIDDVVGKFRSPSGFGRVHRQRTGTPTLATETNSPTPRAASRQGVLPPLALHKLYDQDLDGDGDELRTRRHVEETHRQVLLRSCRNASRASPRHAGHYALYTEGKRMPSDPTSTLRLPADTVSRFGQPVYVSARGPREPLLFGGPLGRKLWRF